MRRQRCHIKTTYREKDNQKQSGVPFRGQVYNTEQLEEHARGLAQSVALDVVPRSARHLYKRLQDTERSLDAAYRVFRVDAQARHPVSRSAEWLLDNFFPIKRQILELRASLASDLCTGLPTLAAGSYAGSPRVYALALELIAHTDSQFDPPAITRFVLAYQSVVPLSLSELWLFPVVLRLGLVENIRRWIELSLIHFHAPQHAEIAVPDETSLGNSITSLRRLAPIVWYKLVESWSQPDRVLEQDPAGAYAQSDFETRELYRRVLEKQSKITGKSETEIAQHAVELASRNPVREPHKAFVREAHVGYYLIDGGLPELKAQLGYQLTLRDRVRNSISEHGIRISPPTLPKLEFKEGIPDQARTIVVVSGILRNASAIESLVGHLEQGFLANRDKNLSFALLTAFDDAAPPRPEDAGLLDTVAQSIQALNEKYGILAGGRFYVFHRERRRNFVASNGVDGGKKWDSLIELNLFLRGSTDTSIALIVGSRATLPQIKYMISLDDETQLPLNAGRRLVGTISHPLNRAVIDPATHRVTMGYGAIRPRPGVTADSAARTLLARIMTSDIVSGAYLDSVSNLDQASFHSGGYTGNAIYDVDVICKAVERGGAEKLDLLALLAGGFARVGFAADIVLPEDFPAGYAAFRARQQHRMQSDWRFVTWFFSLVPDADGKRAPAFLAFNDRWKILDILSRQLMAPLLLLFLLAGWAILPGSAWMWTLIALIALSLPQLPQVLSFLRVHPEGELWRDYALVLARQLGATVQRAVLELSFIPIQVLDNVLALATVTRPRRLNQELGMEWSRAAIVERDRAKTFADYLGQMWLAPVLAVISFILVAWLNPQSIFVAVPFLLLWVASPAIAAHMSQPFKREREILSVAAQTELRLIASKIWLFFERTAIQADHWLPPDNVRTAPGQAIAHRTSPTNIGYLLLATIAAFDFKFITCDELLLRLERVLNTLAGMERYRGHWCNWYDTLTLEILNPRYVSSVDSGNLAGALIIVKQACLELVKTDAERAARWSSLANRADALLGEMDFRFLYNSERELFSIGYNLETNQCDDRYYDLLGSEARLTSYISIALGQAPEQHWFQLGRPYSRVNNHATLLCWGGSLFEYLMPTQFLPDFPDTLMEETYAEVIACHIRSGVAHGTPWGNAEAGFYAFDPDFNYQYKMFGVPELSVRREIFPELVVAPYATFLAMPYLPGRAWENLQALQRPGGLNEYGFYEALDFTSGRVPEGQTVGIVQEFMAHHQGMSLVALDNVLNGDAIRRRFRSELAMAAFEFLLQERVPQHAPVVQMP